MKRPVSLKSKLIIPMVLSIIIIPLLILITFNISVQSHVKKIATNDLTSILKAAQDRELLIENYTKRDSSFLGNFALAFRASKYNSELQYFLLDNKFNILPTATNDETLSSEVYSNIKPHLLNLNASQIETIKIKGVYYVFSYIKLGRGLLTGNILLISNTKFAASFITLVNNIIYASIALAIILSLLFTKYTNKGVIKPIKSLCSYTKKIGNSNFVEVPSNNSFSEILDLTNHMSQMSLKLKDSTEKQNKFMQNVSHEIRTPLMSIRSYAEGIKTGVFTNLDHATTVICDECSRLNKLVNNLLLLSRIENDNYVNDLEEINLNNNLLEYIQSLKGIAAKSDITIEYKCFDNNICVLANDALLTQIIYNIVSNCIRYAKSHVSIILNEVNHYAVIQVKDDGKGFNKDEISRVFNRFYKGQKGNYGLGLTIAKSATEFLKGEISVANHTCGALFLVKLPTVEKS